MIEFLLASLLASNAALSPPAPDQLLIERMLLRQHRMSEAVTAFEAREKRGECPGEVCEAALAIALAEQDSAAALKHAARAIAGLDASSLVSAWEANELGMIFVRASARQKLHLKSAEHAFRYGLAHYEGRGINLKFNLAETLERQGRVGEANSLRAQFRDHILVDPMFAILADFRPAGH